MVTAKAKLKSGGPLTYAISGIKLVRDRYTTITNPEIIERLRSTPHVIMTVTGEDTEVLDEPEVTKEKPKKQKAISL